MADRVFESGAVDTPPDPPAVVSFGYPYGLGPKPMITKAGAWWFHMHAEEVRNVILMGGVVPDHLQLNQMALSIQNVVNQAVSGRAVTGHHHSISDIDGLDAVVANLNNHTHRMLVNGAGAAALDTSGNLTVTGDVTGFSDKRLKTNIEVIEDALSKVKRLTGVTFERLDIENSPRMAGVIAQEVQEVQPELVQQNADGVLSVAYGNMVGLLIEAIKELSQEVSDLKKELGHG